MPFEPRIVARPDDERDPPTPLAHPPEPVWDDAAQLELPDDLAALAEQLRDDAAYLAKRHPADAAPPQRESAVCEAAPPQRQASGRRWYGRPAAAAVVLLAAAGSWWLWKNADRDGVERPTVANAPAGRAAVERASSPAEVSAATASEQDSITVASELPADGPRLIPAAFLREISGPELDGMLDLLLLHQDEGGLSI